MPNLLVVETFEIHLTPDEPPAQGLRETFELKNKLFFQHNSKV